MSSKTLPPRIAVRLDDTAILHGSLIAILAAGVLMALLCPVDPLIRAGLCGLGLAGIYDTIRRRGRPGSLERVVWRERQEWEIHTLDGEVLPARLSGALIRPGLLALRWRTCRGRGFSAVFRANGRQAGELRRLRTRLMLDSAVRSSGGGW